MQKPQIKKKNIAKKINPVSSNETIKHPVAAKRKNLIHQVKLNLLCK